MQAVSLQIPAGRVRLSGDLLVPEYAEGIVVFVHGSGSSRLSRRNRYVAETFNEAHFATLLADFLTSEEEALDAQTGALRFDIPMLADRTSAMIDWIRSEDSGVNRLPIGLYGASTGAAAAIIAAVHRPNTVSAIVSRGGRVDLAGDALQSLRAPLLAIVGSLDHPLLDVHARVLSLVSAPHLYEIVPGAGHLFEERGALDTVADLAVDWFKRYF